MAAVVKSLKGLGPTSKNAPHKQSPTSNPAPMLVQKSAQDVSALFDMGQEIGRGQYGVIRICNERASGRRFACKSIDKRKLSDLEREEVVKEIKIMRLLSGHPAVVGLKGVYEDQKRVHLMMELCEGGDLFEELRRQKRLPEVQAACIGHTLVSAVAAFQTHGLMHRDIKPENVLLASRETSSSPRVKVVDFGLAAFVKPGAKLSAMAGSAYYVAPEVLQGSYGVEADMWSVGVVMYMVLCGVPPFWGQTEEQLFHAILNAKVDVFSGPWEDISLEAKDLVMKMLIRDPDRRITPAKALAHQWFASHIPSLQPFTPLTPPLRQHSLNRDGTSKPPPPCKQDGSGTASTSSNNSFRSDVSVPTWQALDSDAESSSVRRRGQPTNGRERKPVADGNDGNGKSVGKGGVQVAGVKVAEDDLLAIVEAARRKVWGEAAEGGVGNGVEVGKGDQNRVQRGVRSRTAGGRMEPLVDDKARGLSHELENQRGGSEKESRVKEWLGKQGGSNGKPDVVPNDKGRGDILALLEAVSKRIQGVESGVGSEAGSEVRGDYERQSESEELMAIIEAARERVRGGLTLEEGEGKEEVRGGVACDERVLKLMGMVEDGEVVRKEESLMDVLEAARRRVQGAVVDVEQDSAPSTVQDERVLQLLGLTLTAKEETSPASSHSTSNDRVGTGGSAENDGKDDERVLRLLGLLNDSPGDIPTTRLRPRLRMG